MENYQTQPSYNQPTASPSPIAQGAQNQYQYPPQPNQPITNVQQRTPVPPPPPAKLKTTEIEIEEPGKNIKYFFISIAIATIVGSLVIAFLQSSRGAAASQNDEKYTASVGSILESAAFIAKEKAVQDIGAQVSSLQSSLASRIMYTQFFKQLEKSLYKGTRLTKTVINKDGQSTIEGITGGFGDLAKTVDALSNANGLNKVNLVSAEKQTNGAVSFVITLEVDKSILQYKTNVAKSE